VSGQATPVAVPTAVDLARTLREADTPTLRALDLRGARLTGADLEGLDLSGLDFTGAELSGANLAGARLVGASLGHAILTDASLEGAELLGAELVGADLSRARAVGTGFGGANLTGAALRDAKMGGSSFTQAIVRGANFRAADLRGARMREADLRDAELWRADLREADLSESCVSGAVFSHADLRGARISDLTGFENADWIGVDIRDLDLRGAVLIRRFVLDENYLHEFRGRGRGAMLLHAAWSLTSDCGRSFVRWSLWTAFVALLFALLYSTVEIDYGEHPTPLSPLYFSVVTLTTLGFGDVLPASLPAQILVIIEVVVGYLALGGLMSIFANKMARRAE